MLESQTSGVNVSHSSPSIIYKQINKTLTNIYVLVLMRSLWRRLLGLLSKVLLQFLCVHLKTLVTCFWGFLIVQDLKKNFSLL